MGTGLSERLPRLPSAGVDLLAILTVALSACDCRVPLGGSDGAWPVRRLCAVKTSAATTRNRQPSVAIPIRAAVAQRHAIMIGVVRGQNVPVCADLVLAEVTGNCIPLTIFRGTRARRSQWEVIGTS